MSRERKILQLKQKTELAKLGGCQPAIDKQHTRGKLTARERVQLLLDEHSFEELDVFRTTDPSETENPKYGDGIVTGYGTVHNRLVFVYSFDLHIGEEIV